jgi:hypothetical protein
MSRRTETSLTKFDAFRPRLDALPAGTVRDRLVDEADALRRAIAAFHMEAIRFRFYAVDRLLATLGTEGDARPAFEELRHELEAAGFHTRSHAAPESGTGAR